jgi:CBS domain-containing protein
MSRFPETVRAGASIQEAAARMRAFDVGFLPVVRGEEIVGVVTDRDLVVRGMSDGRSPARLAVAEIMTTDVVTCEEDATVDTIARSMVVLEVRRIAVVASGRELVGIIGLADLVRAGHEGVAGLILGVLTRCVPGLPPEFPERF